MARHLNLAVCQTGPVQRSATRAETVGRLVHLLEQAASAGAELAVFPEMALTTFFPRWALAEDEIDGFYEDRMPGPSTRPLFDAARRLKIGFALGYCETLFEDGRKRRFNTMDLIGPDGETIGRYRKMHVPGSETPEAGNDHASRAALFRAGRPGLSGVRVSRHPRRARPVQRPALAGNLSHAVPQRRRGGPDRLQYARFCSTRRRPWRICACSTTTCRCRPAPTRTRSGSRRPPRPASRTGRPDRRLLRDRADRRDRCQATSLGDEVLVHRADLDLIAACRRVNFDFARYRRPEAYRLIAERAGPPV